MHHCLRIAEILNLIITCLVEEGSRGACEVISLLRTCTVFYEPALDILWRDLDIMAPLVMCLPGDAWKIKNRVLCLTRGLKRKEWQRYMFHAQRVKSIGLEHPGLAAPNRFNFRLHPDTSAVLLPILPHTCPSLVHLNICSSIEPPTAIVASSAAMCGACDLHTLGINAALSEEALTHLSSLTRLRTLEINWESKVTVGDDGNSLQWLALSMPPSRGRLFPALQKLAFSASSLSACTNFIRSIRSRKLESLSLIVDRSRSDTYDDALRLFSLLGSEVNPYLLLTHISIRHLHPVHKVYNIHLLYRYIRRLTTITSTTLQPLLRLSNLTVLDINPMLCSFDLDDAFLILMAMSWPSLQTLFLGHIFGWHRPSRITLNALVPLVAYCPDLQNLGIVLDATVDPIPSDDDRPINDKITCLYLGDSKPSIEPHPSHIAQFLSDLFPMLSKICVSPPNARDISAWDTVEDMVLQLGEFGEIMDMEEM